jgi:hypothetical protein
MVLINLIKIENPFNGLCNKIKFNILIIFLTHF